MNLTSKSDSEYAIERQTQLGLNCMTFGPERWLIVYSHPSPLQKPLGVAGF